MPVESVSDGLGLPDRFEVSAVREWVTRVFHHAGLSSTDSATIADCLMFAETRGVASHGLARLDVYLRRLAEGGTKVRPHPSDHSTGVVTVTDADGGAGAPAGMRAAAAALRAARQHGVGLVAVRNTNHCGALGYYANWLAEQGLVAVVMSNADPIMGPPGGGSAVLGSNPLAIAVPPVAVGAPLLDMATTAAAYGKIMGFARKGAPIPHGWAVDADGHDTTDAEAALRGALLPAAGPKGFGLSFMIDVLTAGLAGGRTGTEIAPLFSQLNEPQGVCLVVVAIDPVLCGGVAALEEATTRVAGAVRGSRGATDVVNKPMLPGEPERRHGDAHVTEIEVEEELLLQLRGIGTAAGIPMPQQFAAAG